MQTDKECIFFVLLTNCCTGIPRFPEIGVDPIVEDGLRLEVNEISDG